jgi:hypothetical protein
MIKHIVIWTLKDFAGGLTKQANARKIKQQLEGLKFKIPQIKSLEVGININKTSKAYDIVLYAEFANAADLDIYQNHPEHLKIGEFISKVRSDRIAVDYEI